MPQIGRLRYLEAPRGGTGRSRGTLVLIHAFPLNASMWEPQFTLADGGWRVIAPQLRGMDGVAGDPPVTSMDDYAGDIIDLLDALRIDEAVIGGLSMGGYVAFALFRLAPRYFSGMVLSDTRPDAETPEGIEKRNEMLRLVRHHGLGAVADQMLPKLLAEETLRDREDVGSRVHALMRAGSVPAVEGAIRALMTRQDARPMLPSIHCPTLVVVGARDTLTPPAIGREMLGAIGGAELVIVPNAGHLPNLEQPLAFNGALARFLEHRV